MLPSITRVEEVKADLIHSGQPNPTLKAPEDILRFDADLSWRKTKDKQYIVYVVAATSSALFAVPLIYKRQGDGRRDAALLREKFAGGAIRDTRDLHKLLAAALVTATPADRTACLCIPTIGQELTLTRPWHFSLHNERRNHDFYQEIKPTPGLSPYADVPPIPASLPAGARLRVERIYIRTGAQDFDSISFRMIGGHPYKDKHRFWVKLPDANTLDCILHGR